METNIIERSITHACDDAARPTGTCGYPISIVHLPSQPLHDAAAIEVRYATAAEYDAACVAALLGV